MLIVQKFYIKEFLKVLLLLSIGLSFIFSIIGLVEKIDELLLHRPPLGLLLGYAVLGIPRFLRYLMPIAILLSGLFIFSQAIKRMEIVAIKAAGAKMKSMLRPFILIGVILCIIEFVIGETLVPFSSKMTRAIHNQIMKKTTDYAFKEGSLYAKGRDGSIIRIGLYLPDQNVSREVTIFRFDSQGLHEVITAEAAQWEKETWVLKDVTVYKAESGKTLVHQTMAFNAIESPKMFREDVWKVEEMTIVELSHYQARLKEAGFKNTKFTVDISSRLSFPLVNLFMVLLGIALSIGDVARHLLHGKVAGPHSHAGVLAAGLGLLISLAYWFGHSFFLSLGYAGTISPAIAPWIIPLFFGVLAVYLYRQIPE